MRARKKKHLTERIAQVNNIAVYEQIDFFTKSDEERTQILDTTSLFGNTNPIYLELGCGKGEFACKLAATNPDINILAVEKYSNIIISACEKAENQQLTNLKFINTGAENLLYFLNPHTISRIYLNFSCPYPKNTYANNRLTHDRFLAIYDKLLVENGLIFQKTDNPNFFEYSLLRMNANNYTIKELSLDLHNSIYSSHNIVTEYETRYTAEGKKIMYMCAVKK